MSGKRKPKPSKADLAQAVMQAGWELGNVIMRLEQKLSLYRRVVRESEPEIEEIREICLRIGVLARDAGGVPQ